MWGAAAEGWGEYGAKHADTQEWPAMPSILGWWRSGDRVPFAAGHARTGHTHLVAEVMIETWSGSTCSHW